MNLRGVGMSILIIINLKSYGGFYIDKIKDWSFHICLGWIVITICKKDIEDILEKQMGLGGNNDSNDK